MNHFQEARLLLREFKGEAYIHGIDALPSAGALAAGLGCSAILVRDAFPGSEPFLRTLRDSVILAGVEVIAEVDGASPNAPLEDLIRITAEIGRSRPDSVISFGGGSTLDAAKAAEVLSTLGGDIEEYFGVGLVSQKLAQSPAKLRPHLAIQTAASSGAHLTKYSNITNLQTGQKKLIVDEAIVPPRALFDYAVTLGSPPALTADGALDGMAHCLEVLYSSSGKPAYEKVEPIAREGLGLILEHLPEAMTNPQDSCAREALGLGTDLGAYAIMLGGTGGAHLASFSLVDILSHGRACGMLNPYFTVFFAPAIEAPLRVVADIYAQAGYGDRATIGLRGRDLGVAVAQAMIAFEHRIGFPATLDEVPGFSKGHMERVLTAAKNPQLRMKLENMPVPLKAEMVDEYLAPVLEAARTGQLDLIKNVAS